MEEQWSPKEAWWRFRVEVVAAQNYHLSSSLIGPHFKNILLERMLPILLYIKAVTILDDSFDLWLYKNNHILSKPYKNDLNGRIQYLVDIGVLSDRDRLHGIRRRRNDFAHEPEISCSWDELSEAIFVMEDNLMILGLVRITQRLEFFYERSPIASSDPDIALSHEYKYGVKEDGAPVFEVSTIVNHSKIAVE